MKSLNECIGKRQVDRDRVLAETRERIASEGPLRSRDFKAVEGRRGGAWWEWKPHKAALEYL